MSYSCSMKAISALYFLIITVAGLTPVQIEKGACLTPDDKPSICIPVAECQPILAFVRKTPKPISPIILNSLLSYKCSSNNLIRTKGNMVCCPHGPVIIGRSNSEIKSPNPEDVSNHKNLKLLPTDCGHLDSNKYIINGELAGLFEFPWMALLVYNSSGEFKFYCGGTIINNRYIMTAAHCIRNDLINIRVGEHDTRSEIDCDNEEGTSVCAPAFQNLEIEEVVPHQNYNDRTKVDDIALIRVSEINTNIESTRPVCLPLEESRNYNFTNRITIVTGWGAIDEKRTSSPVLLKVSVPVVPLEDCQEVYLGKAQLNYRQLCAGGKDNKDSCVGDSGGPLHVVDALHGDARYIQQGIVSFGPKPCGQLEFPAVYTKVAHYMGWILDNMRP